MTPRKRERAGEAPGESTRRSFHAGRLAVTRQRLWTQQVEPAEYDDTAQYDHRDGVLAEVENRGGKPRRDAEGADAGHRVFLECVMK
ncbi:hypothetical protein [Burkholderia lata]|uniref:hypothetical protein n=1 Tax=Burkholderia lata (strain ATCC 17760 / DSM 23089 / LMG 22485 / NCIMB 9086 / R18194 / 383) TaxID=482957 RepID=UPI001583FCDA|nr:hypothetical protein [Burkholderia lata]